MQVPEARAWWQTMERNAKDGEHDFDSLGTEWDALSVFRYVGGTDPDAYDKARQTGRVAQDILTNHSPNFAPVIHPTLETGIEAMVVAAQAWLSS